MIKESDYDLTLKKLYEEHKLLVSSLFEIFGDEIKSASLFCLENGISIRERDKIILLLIKFSANHSIYELDFWKDTLITGIPILSELDDKEFQKMLILFSDYYLAYQKWRHFCWHFFSIRNNTIISHTSVDFFWFHKAYKSNGYIPNLEKVKSILMWTLILQITFS